MLKYWISFQKIQVRRVLPRSSISVSIDLDQSPRLTGTQNHLWTHPVHVCFSFKVGATPHKAAMRSMELMMSQVRPRVERALGPLARRAAE
jgi:hypothetical protein